MNLKQKIQELSLDQKAKLYFMGLLRKGVIDTLPKDPKAAYIRDMMDKEDPKMDPEIRSDFDDPMFESLKKTASELGYLNEEKKLTYANFVQMVRDDMMAGAAPDEKPNDKQVASRAKSLYNDYLQGASVDDLFEEKEIKEITVSGGQEAARNYPPTENPGDMFAQKEVEDLLPASFASRNQELKARIQGHANWAKQDRFNNTFVHFQSNTVTDGNNTYRIAMSQHYNGNYTGFKNPRFTEIRVKELDNESDMERDLGKYVVDTTALMQDLRKLKTIERVS